MRLNKRRERKHAAHKAHDPHCTCNDCMADLAFADILSESKRLGTDDNGSGS